MDSQPFELTTEVQFTILRRFLLLPFGGWSVRSRLIFICEAFAWPDPEKKTIDLLYLFRCINERKLAISCSDYFGQQIDIGNFRKSISFVLTGEIERQREKRRGQKK